MQLTARETDLKNELLSRRDCVLLSAMAGESLTPADMAILTDGMDVDTESSVYMLLLGVIGYRRGFAGMAEDAVPRLQGLHRFYQARDAAGTPWLCGQIATLREAGIPAMFTGEIAMRAAYAPNVPRVMFGYDITVPSGDYDRAAELLRDAVRAAVDSDNPKKRTVRGHTVIRLHKGVPDSELWTEQDLWQNAAEVMFHGEKVLVCSPTDMLFDLLTGRRERGIFTEEREARNRRFCECLLLSENAKPDWQLIAKKAAACGCANYCRFLLRMLSDNAPSHFPQSEWNDAFPGGREYDEFTDNLFAFGRKQRDRAAKRSRSLIGAFRLAKAEYRMREPELAKAGKSESFSAYVRRTRKISGVGDVIRKMRKTEG